nr:PREDICTED: interleukin-1 receptor-associated kinase 4-like [Bemisia tabaci]
MPTADMELRHLPPQNRTELISILEVRDSWRSLIEIIPQEGAETPKFTAEHVRLIENASLVQKRSCSEILLEEWGTMGRKRPDLELLLKLLTKAELLRAADYIASVIGLNPAARPTDGPAAPVCVSSEMRVIAHDSSSVGTRPETSTESDSSHSEQTVIERKPEFNDCNTNPTAHLQETEAVGCSLSPAESDLLVLKFRELEKATDNFSEANKLGEGAFGAVYACALGEKKAAVKKFNEQEDVDLQALFLNEIQSLKRYRHKNLLPLLGYSCDVQLCLVYEFMPNGCLQEKIALKDEGKILGTDERLQIAVGTAEGINYLHTAFDKPLIHRDVKSANILLDAQLIPKLGDFGLVRSISSGTSNQTTTAIGTSAYMAPEAFRGDISIKMDTYSFGVVSFLSFQRLLLERNMDGYHLCVS